MNPFATELPSGIPLELPALAPPAPAAPPVPRPRRALGLALGVGLLAELLLDGRAPGLGFPLACAAAAAALLSAGGREGLDQARPGLWLLAPLGLFSAMVALRDCPWLTALNLLASTGLLGLLAYAAAGARVGRLGPGGYLRVGLEVLGHGLTAAPPLVRAGAAGAVDRRTARALRPYLLGLAIAAPVLLVFAALLAQADLVFASLLDRVLQLDIDLGRLASGGVMALGAAWGMAGLMVYAQRRVRAEPAPAAPVARLGSVEGMVLAGSVDALFALFAAVQSACLFGGAGLPVRGLSYAEYARRGFFELLAVAVLSLLLVVGLNRWVQQARALKAACAVQVALVLGILAGAVKRLTLYEEAYGYTALRLVAHVFMLALAGLLLWRAVTLWWRPERFAAGVLAVGLAFLAALDLADPDAFVARQNLARYERTGSLDAEYLGSLSADAVPAVAGALPRLPSGAAWTLASSLGRHHTPTPDAQGWPSLNLARARAQRAAWPAH